MNYTLKELEGMKTLCTGQADDLKVDEGGRRVWLSRCGVDDGMEYDHMVSVETHTNGKWEVTETYQAL